MTSAPREVARFWKALAAVVASVRRHFDVDDVDDASAPRRPPRLPAQQGSMRVVADMRVVAEQAMSGRPLAECHGSKASLWQAGNAAGAQRSLTLPLHDAAMVSPISAVPWAVTLWRDLSEGVLLAATCWHAC
jgi:hypothetical protein